MILWINGAFGVGKTQTAFELQKRISNSIVFDPEEVGFFIQNIIPHEFKKSDFQDYKTWRTTVSGILKEIHGGNDCTIIVPMTVVSPEYFSEIIDPIKEAGIDIVNYTLMAKKETIENRLRSRNDGKSWNFQQVDRCLKGLTHPIFQNYVHTDHVDLYGVVEHIGADLRLSLVDIPQTKFARWIRRTRVFLKHIRII